MRTGVDEEGLTSGMATVEALLERSVELKRELSAFLHDRRIGREFEAVARHRIPADLATAETVGLIFDEEDGLGYYEDFALFRSAFADEKPSRAALNLVRSYVESPSTSPLPLKRCVAAHPDRADAVLGAALGRRGFSWSRDGEALLRRHKPDYRGTPHPGVSIVADRLRPYLAPEHPE
jgi:hypothetical protein